MSRPWKPARERSAAWWAVMSPDGRTLGIYFHMTYVDAWVDRHPDVWWRVVFWFRGAVRSRCDVRSKPAWARAPNEQPRWRTLKTSGRKKGGEDGGGIV
ncbi:hypothetical protein [Paludisphaera rhizosphaerae]|uniref:hypothetical protein n=1 Tax=Paludisphaera rhizosphaerae TaxID=2711216 RepID=UPI0013ED216B|nr:hypothetical protein [Paludisphaera rhizosphaerae]